MLNALKQAVRGLLMNPVRTGLTTLGIVIGIATVIIVLSAGEGFRSFINAQVDAFGTNTISVQTKVPPTTKTRNGGFDGSGGNAASQAVTITTLKNRDVEDIKLIPYIDHAYGAVITQKVTSYQGVSKNAFIFGADPERFLVDKGVLSSGRPYTDSENNGAAQVAILGHDIAQDFFADQDPIGKFIRVGEYNFLVIGVYERRGSFGFSNDDQQVFVPLNTAQKKLAGIDYLFFILAQVKDQNFAEAAAEDMRSVLRRNHAISDPVKDDFEVQTQAQGLETFNTVLAGITFLLIAVAAISLLVGGVGIMNIMYVVVTERISEIGLKKALGAKPFDILMEFLIESTLLTVFGGGVGILIGAGISYFVSVLAQSFGFAWVFAVPVYGIVLAVGVAGAIGLLFGVLPARRASLLDPVEALRYE
jgi:ABC-type antimicrobial peptide transport system permease subunit